MSCRMDGLALSLRVHWEPVDLILVQKNRKHFLLLVFIRVTRVALDDFEALICVEADLARLQEYFGEEILKLEDTIVVGLL